MTTRTTLWPLALAALAPISASAAVTAPLYQVRPDCAARPRCFATIAQAVEATNRDTGDHRVTIRIAPGDYREKVTISRPRTTLTGAGATRTRLHYDAVAQSARAWHRDGWGTAGSATLTINAVDVTVRGIAIENDFDYLANDARAASDPQRIANAQAVALLLDIASDRVRLHAVSLIGYQDTLFANGARAHVRDSLITGNIDFIFGNGMLLIEDSELRSRPRAASLGVGELQSYILAPSTPRAQPFGIVVIRSRLTREPGVPDGAVALARPWHPTTTFPDGRYGDPDAIGHASFIDCHMDAHISAKRWANMAGTARDGTKSALFLAQDARFSETGSHGPGAPPPTATPALRALFWRDWLEK